MFTNAGTVATAHVYIILTNWNGWRDTIECLESLFRLNYPSFTVVVCDNDSSDGSLEQIRGWARGETTAQTANPELCRLTSPPVAKPIRFLEFHSNESGTQEHDAPLILIQTGSNLGFAGGCNAGLRYALQQPNWKFAWLLNNDTVVDPDALSQLVRRMQERPDAGICGSTLLYYNAPGIVQACGGSIYNKWVARSGNIGRLAPAAHLPDAQEVERKMAYVYGAAMLVRRAFLEQVGLMSEQYLAYFEELDWAARARGRFALAYSPGAIIYHKEGQALGSSVVAARSSPRAEFYANRNRILFTRAYYPHALCSVLAAIGASAIDRSLKMRWKNLAALARGTFAGLRQPLQILGDEVQGPRRAN